MTATVVMARHGSHGRLGKVLCGRVPGVELSEQGLDEARALAAHLAQEPIAAVYSSPLDRTRQTAEPICEAAGLPLQIEDGLLEIDFGRWSGMAFEALHDDPDWRRWNQQRASARPPGGESMREAQARTMEAVGRLAARHDGGRIVLVSHGDVIKAAVCGVLACSLDNYDRFEISPASITVFAVGDWGMKLHSMNEAPRCR